MPLFSQIDDLSMFGIDGSALDRVSTDSDMDLSQKRETESPKKESIDKDKYKDYGYGYTGGISFINPPQKKLPDEPLEYFGYNYFSDESRTFSPLMNVPVSPDYLIGPDDVIKIILYGNKNKKYNLKVSRDGEIFIPELGPLSVAGLTFETLQDLIDTTITNQFIGTEASITLGSLRTIDIFILGAANNPGMFSISALSTMTNAIFESGGVATSGSLRNIKLKRNGNTITEFDLYDLLLNGDTSNDKRLMQGDVILVEPIGKTAGIRGEVYRAGIYELRDDESINDLLKFSGNPKPKANISNSEIIRVNRERNSFDLIKIDLEGFSQENKSIKNGDTVTIYPVNDKMQNAILVRGHTPQPGFYSWQENMKITDLFRSPDDLLEMTDLNYLLIKRKEKSSQEYSFHQVDLEEAFTEKESEQNIVLYDQDELLFLPSLLSKELIKTKLIQDKFELDEETDELIPQEEWTSLAYLKKSLGDNREASLNLRDQGITPSDETNPDEDLIEKEYESRYYEYSIYDYCTIPQEIILLVGEIEDPDDPDSQLKKDELSRNITQSCRDQLLKPMLDIINRESSNEKLNLVSVFGNVHFPGKYPYTSNMKLGDVIKAGGGPKNGTYSSEIELTSLNNIGKQFTSTNTISSIRDIDQVQIKRMDIVTLKQLTSEVRSVEVTGEVYFPGTYPITENETLLSLIKRAGGITPFGSAEAAVFQRESLKKLEQKRLKEAQAELQRKILLSNQSDSLGQNDDVDVSQLLQLTSLISLDQIDEESMGRLVLDLQGILNKESADIELVDGDTINIPKSKQSVSVIGEVFVSNTHIYSDDLDIDDYIKLSGGVTTFADESSIYLVKADGSIISPSDISSNGFFRGGSSSLSPGDTIVVPLEVAPFSQLRATTEITQIIYQMALAAAAVNSF